MGNESGNNLVFKPSSLLSSRLQNKRMTNQSSGGMGLLPSQSYTLRRDNQNFPQAGTPVAPPYTINLRPGEFKLTTRT